MAPTKKILRSAAVAVFWLTVWQLAAAAAGMEILIPSPASVAVTLMQLIKSQSFWSAVFLSMVRILAGFLSAVAAGVAGAVLSSRFSVIRSLTSPVLHIIRAAPVASFIILALVWFKSGILPAFISFLMVLPIIWDSVEAAIKNVDRRLLEMAKVFRLSQNRVLLEIKLPSIFPSFMSACMTSLGFAWKSGIAAEVICRPADSLGGMLQNAKIYLETPEVFALTAVVAVLSLLLELIIRRIVRRFVHDSN